ncbi:MAG: ABC transporter permease [Ancalomicrobiaceae bacterium]|nr:ABC transporter permease [Ancalomicrobiaceae bacterium]
MAEQVSSVAPISSDRARKVRRLIGRGRRFLSLDAKVAFGGLIILIGLALAIFAPLISPADPLEQDLMSATLPPIGFAGADPAHLLGTDDLGRDVLARLLYGGRVAFTVAFVAAGLAGLIGTVLGLVAGWYGRLADTIVSRLIDIWMAFPPVLLSILLVAVFGSGLHSVIAAIVIIDWTRFARVVRAETMAQAALDYVTAARAIGFPRLHVLLNEIVPNLWPVIVALLSLEAGIAVIVEAILSFVGLSVSSDTPTWGGMIASGRQILHQGWWVLAAPLAVLFVTVLAFNLFGEGMRRTLDPVMRR